MDVNVLICDACKRSEKELEKSIKKVTVQMTGQLTEGMFCDTYDMCPECASNIKACLKAEMDRLVVDVGKAHVHATEQVNKLSKSIMEESKSE